jgi:hypothetical protein
MAERSDGFQAVPSVITRISTGGTNLRIVLAADESVHTGKIVNL